MSKSYKLKDENYIDSTGIVHNKKSLSGLLNRSSGFATFTVVSSAFTFGGISSNKILDNIVSVTLSLTTATALSDNEYAVGKFNFSVANWVVGIGANFSNTKRNVSFIINHDVLYMHPIDTTLATGQNITISFMAFI